MTERDIRQATRTSDARPAPERIEQLEEEVTALRKEMAKVRRLVLEEAAGVAESEFGHTCEWEECCAEVRAADIASAIRARAKEA